MEAMLSAATGKTVSLLVTGQWLSGKIVRVSDGLVYVSAIYGDLIIRSDRVDLLSVEKDGKPT